MFSDRDSSLPFGRKLAPEMGQIYRIAFALVAKDRSPK